MLWQWVIDGPAKQGLDRANWTYAELADQLYKTKDIRVGKSALHAFGARYGIHPYHSYRPMYKFLHGDKALQQKAREEIPDLKKVRKRVNASS